MRRAASAAFPVEKYLAMVPTERGGMKKIAIALLLLVIAGCSRISSEGIDAVQKALEAGDENYFLLGNAVVGSATDFNNGMVSNQEYDQMSWLAKAGYLHFVKDENLADRNFHGFDNWFRTSQGGITRNIDAELTPLGGEINRAFKETDSSRKYEETRLGIRLLKVRLAISAVDRIVSNRLIEKDAERYRVVEFIDAIRPTEPYVRMNAACGRPAGRQKLLLNARALVKWNAFRSAWDFVTMDIARLSGAFQTNNVPDTLSGPSG